MVITRERNINHCKIQFVMLIPDSKSTTNMIKNPPPCQSAVPLFFPHMFLIFPRFLWHPIHRIGWWENLQESPIFDGKSHGFRLRFSLKPIHWSLASHDFPQGSWTSSAWRWTARCSASWPAKRWAWVATLCPAPCPGRGPKGGGVGGRGGPQVSCNLGEKHIGSNS